MFEMSHASHVVSRASGCVSCDVSCVVYRVGMSCVVHYQSYEWFVSCVACRVLCRVSCRALCIMNLTSVVVSCVVCLVMSRCVAGVLCYHCY